jgi:molecular chaperone IbpA
VKYSDDTYGIEVAVAGFTKEEVTVEVDQDQLTIRGIKDRPNVDTGQIEYLHRGLAARDFEQTFTLAEYMIVRGAKVEHGMLQIDIQRVVPEALKPRQIEIK